MITLQLGAVVPLCFQSHRVEGAPSLLSNLKREINSHEGFTLAEGE